MGELDYAWMVVNTTRGGDQVPCVRWGKDAEYLLIECEYGSGQMFIPHGCVPEFFRRVQAAVAVGFHPEPSNPQVMTEFGPVEDVTMEAAERSAA